MSTNQILLLLLELVAAAAVCFAIYRYFRREAVLQRYFPALVSRSPREVALEVDPLFAPVPSQRYQRRVQRLVGAQLTLVNEEESLQAIEAAATAARLHAEKSERKLTKAREAMWFRGTRVAKATVLYDVTAAKRAAAAAEKERSAARVDAAIASVRKLESAVAAEREEWLATLPEAERAHGPRVERNTLMVMFFDHVKPKRIAALLKRYRLSVVAGTPKLSLFLLRPEAPPRADTAEGGATRLHALVERLRAEPVVEAAVQNLPLGPVSVAAITERAEDPLTLTSFREAWELVKGKPEIEVGVLDVGFLADSKELQVIPMAGTPNQTDVHGMQVAAIIGAAHNDFGIDGGVPRVKIVGASPRDPLAFDFIDTLERTIARQPRLRLINASVGYNWAAEKTDPEKLPALRRAIENSGKCVRKALRNASETLLVAAAGNDSSETATARAVWASPYNWAALGDESDDLGKRSENVIVVEGLDSAGTGRLPMSNTGGTLKAIGQGVMTITSTLSPVPRDGTSAAAPLVTSTAAMMLQVNPKLTVKEIKEMLGVGSSDPRLNAFSAVKKAAEA
ncbi:MAG TPA: S8 family serine peptidase [Thermoanaerobaculia bacterium]|jgi:hypothetical protein